MIDSEQHLSPDIPPNKKRGHFRLFGNFEDAFTRTLRPSDWTIISLLFGLMALGAGILFAHTAHELAVSVPERGGVHIEGVLGTPRFVNPLLANSDADRDLTALIYSGLMRVGHGGVLEPDIAEGYDISDDLRTYTFTLRQGVQFHDGTPITADDVAFTIQMARHPDVKSTKRANWEGVDVVVLDARTISFTLQSPFAPFLENTTLGVLPKHLWGGMPPDEFPFTDLNTRPVGSGPYRVHEVRKTASGVPTEYRLRAFQRGGREPLINNFVLKFYQDEQSLLRAFESSDVHAAHSLFTTALPRGAVTHEAVFARVFGIFFNQNQQELFASQTVRRALNASLDKGSIVDTIIGGYGVPLDGPLPPQTPHRTLDDGDEEAALEEARSILEDAGWEIGDDGFYERTTQGNTTRLAFSLSAPAAPELRRAAEYVVATWQKLGADVTLSVYEQAELNAEVIRPRRYDAILFGLIVGRELDLFAFWHSSQRNDPGLNIALYANITTDRLLEEARSEMDQALRREKAMRAAEEIATETAAIFLYAPTFVYHTQNAVQGIALQSISAPSDRFYAVHSWYLNTERVWPLFAF